MYRCIRGCAHILSQFLLLLINNGIKKINKYKNECLKWVTVQMILVVLFVALLCFEHQSMFNSSKIPNCSANQLVHPKMRYESNCSIHLLLLQRTPRKINWLPEPVYSIKRSVLSIGRGKSPNHYSVLNSI